MTYQFTNSCSDRPKERRQQTTLRWGLGGRAMFSILNSRLLQRSFLIRLLQTTGLSVALMTASAAGVRAEEVTVQGSPGMSGADGVNPGEPGQPGSPADPTFADATSADPVNKSTAIVRG
jgi:hypothetical protein